MKPPRHLPHAALCRMVCLSWCLVGGSTLCRASGADDALPKPPPAKRYDKLAAHSPFAPPTAPLAAPGPTPPPPPGPAWTDNLTVTSLMQSGDLYTATVVEKDSSTRHFIRSDDVDKETNLTLTGVRWADKSDAIKVTVRKGALFGELKFDPNAASAAPAGPAPGGPLPLGTRPGFPNPAANFHPPPPVATAAQNPPGGVMRGRPVIRATPPALVRPIVPAPVVPNRAAPAGKPAVNDDDDDNDC